MAGKHSKSKKNININNDISKKTSKLKKKKNNVLIILILFICIALFVYSLIQIFKWFKDSKVIKDEMSEINEIVTITEINTKEVKEEVVENKKEKKSSPYWDYLQMNLIDVNFKELKKVNPDVKGWVQVNGTNINYPFVQTSNNDYYLTHSITKQSNSAGWVFMDYRNNSKTFDKNTIIYAHARVNQYMFGTLKNTLKNNWLNNKTNHVIKLSTESKNTLWQIFSIYHIPTTNDYMQTNFSNNEEFSAFLNLIKDRSINNFETTVNKNDKILTLSTCYGNDEKLVVHAKLIKYVNK